jgi:hypothetical protein
MKVKLLTLLTLLTISLTAGIPTTSARALIDGEGAPTTTTTTTTPQAPTSITNTPTSPFTDFLLLISNSATSLSNFIKNSAITIIDIITGNSNPTITSPTTCTASGKSFITKKAGEQFTVNWCAVNVKSCSVTGPEFPSGTSCLADASSTIKRGSSSIIISTPGTYTYTIVGNGNTVAATVIIVPNTPTPTPTNTTTPSTNTNSTNALSQPVSAPTCTIGAKPSLVKLPNSSTFLEWSCDRTISVCSIIDNNPKVADIGAVPSSGSRETPIVGSTTKFTIKCPGAADASVTVGLFNSNLKEIIPQ